MSPQTISRIFFVIALLFQNAAHAGYHTYSEIYGLPWEGQLMYISGAADGISAATTKYNPCMAVLKMNAGQFAKNVMSFAASRPAVHSLNMALVVTSYLKEACPLRKTGT